MIIHRSQNVAVIDIGTSKAKFIIASVSRGRVEQTLFKEKRLINIGAGLNTACPAVSAEAVIALEQILHEYASSMQRYGVTSVRVVGTDALRQASNIAEVEALVRRETGASLEILSQQEEARLFFSTVSSRFPGRVAVVDVGGGSVQLTIGSRRGLESSYLLRTGTVTLQQTYIRSSHPSSEELDMIWQHVRKQIGLLGLAPKGITRLVYGSTNIVDFFREAGVGSLSAENIPDHPLRASVSELVSLYHRIVQYPYEARSGFFPSDPSFMYGADLSLVNVLCLCEVLGVSEVIPTNINLSDALLASLV